MDGQVTRSIQCAPDGMLSGIPSQIVALLADPNGRGHGYGYGSGAAMVFGSSVGDISVLPGQWVNLHDDGSVTVTDENMTED